ncbi:hypothetical protein NHQ30_000429 [Ciborinia camelliae]|nr:hypothetical protein NHQ30_000429 [Ciborinia camelliae]
MGLLGDLDSTKIVRTVLEEEFGHPEHGKDGMKALRNVLLRAIAPKLRIFFQLDVDKCDQNSFLANLRLDEVGIDSLIAVDLRSWFMKNLEVNIPVLKILNGCPVGKLITIAMEKLNIELIPNVASDVAVSQSTDIEHSPQLTLESASSQTSYSSKSDIDEPELSSKSPQLDSDLQGSPRSVVVESVKSFQLSFSQAMFWFVMGYLDDKTTLNHTGCFRVTGTIRISDLQEAVLAIGKHHEIFRARFSVNSGQRMQLIMESSVLCLEQRHIDDIKEVQAITSALEKHVYDIERGETMKFILLSLSPEINFFVIGIHHLVIDGFSFPILMNNLLQLYNHQSLPATLQYAEHSQRQHEDYQAGNFYNELLFWKNEFSDFPPPLPILRVSQSVSRPVLKTYDTRKATVSIDSHIRGQIQSVCRLYKVTPFHFYLTTLRALLLRFGDTDMNDIVIGIGDANRTEDNMLGSIGPYVNILPVRFRNSQLTCKFDQALRESRLKTYSVLENSKVPFQILLKDPRSDSYNRLNAPRSATHSAIFQCFINHQQATREKETWGDCQLELLSFQSGRTGYDLSLNIMEYPTMDTLILTVRAELYTQKAVEILMLSYQSLVKDFARDPGLSLAEPDIYSKIAVQEAMKFGQGISLETHWPETLVHRFRMVAQMYPNSPAIRSENEILTYSDMISRVNSIVVGLLEAGIRHGSRVAVLQEPTFDWICSIYAVMYLGAVYFPLDLSFPLERLAVIIGDCNPTAILIDESADKRILSILRDRAIQTIKVSDSVSSSNVPPIAATAHDAAVILYTSGSSGVPKGVVLGHGGLLNWAEAAAGIDHIGAEIVLQQSSPSFDLSLGQMLVAHCYGGSLYLLQRHHRGDALSITEIIASKFITFTMATPSEHFSWIKYGRKDLLKNSQWTTAACGGELIVDALLQQFEAVGKSDLRFFSTYGPTETTIYTTAMQLSYSPNSDTPRDHIPAGYVLPNSSVYVLDEYLNPVPPGVQGEIYIGGAGVAHGYLNNETQTAERFVPNIFASVDYISKGWTTMHRTGDLGRWAANGGILLEGRISGDTQIKLRGLRIDLRDIENTIIESAKGALSQVVVSARQDIAQALVAHVIFDPDCPQDRRNHCLKTLSYNLPLPQYMRPALIIPLSNLPMTDSLKLDRRAIATLPLPAASGKQGNPCIFTEMESLLKSLWHETISKELSSLYTITPDTDFFHVGGTSLMLLDLQARIRTGLGVTLPLVLMFESSSLASMAMRIENGASIPRDSLNWEEETALSPYLLQSKSIHYPFQQDPKVVILTGATGFVGHSILMALVTNPSVEKIHCIGVRNVESRKSMLGIEKVSLYEGDLMSARLGLSAHDSDLIFREADRIIHNGADVSYLKTFQSLRLANLQSTKELIEMCLPRHIPFYCVSTTGIRMFSPKDKFGEVSAAENPPPVDGSLGYAASKWTSEQYLEKVNKHCGWPITILRPSSISRQEILELDLMQSLIKYSKLIKGVPSFPNVSGGINFVSLESIVKCVMTELHRGSIDETRYVHLIGDINLPLDNIKLFLNEEDKDGFAELSVEDWVRRAEPLGLHKILVAFFENIPNVQRVVFPRLLKHVQEE